LAWDLGYHTIILESNSKLIIDLIIKNDNFYPHAIVMIIRIFKNVIDPYCFLLLEKNKYANWFFFFKMANMLIGWLI
jgi:hypothetical protein